jgi:hypothetical protein
MNFLEIVFIIPNLLISFLFKERFSSLISKLIDLSNKCVCRRYRVEDLPVDGLYKFKFGVKVCLDKNTCPVDIQILNETLIPKPNCFMKLQQGYTIKGKYTL